MAAKRPKRLTTSTRRTAAKKSVRSPAKTPRSWLGDPNPRKRIAGARAALSGLKDAHARTALHAAIIEAQLEAGDKSAARREWLAMVKAGLTPVRAAIEAGLLAEQLKKMALAEADYRLAGKTARSLGDRAEAWTALARFYMRTGQAQIALPLLRERARGVAHPLIAISAAYVEARIGRTPRPLEKHRKTMERLQKQYPIFGYFLGYLDLWDGRELDAIKSLRRFVSKGIDAAASWGRDLAPELDHARRTILQLEAISRVTMP